MMSVAICDDEGNVIGRIERVVQGWAKSQAVDIAVVSCSSGIALLEKWQQHHFDLIFLDIDMPGMNGFDTAKKIREYDDNAIIVFLTGVAGYVYQGYEVKAFRYLMKPVLADTLANVLSDALAVIRKRRVQHITINNDGSYIKINVLDIMYVESFAHSVEIVTKIARISYNKPIMLMEKQLSAFGFFRCHRSFLVNLSYVNSVENNWLILTNGKMLPVSRIRVHELKTAILHQI